MEKERKKNQENLQGQDAIKKLQDLIDKESICLFCTHLQERPMNVRPMSTLQVDDAGNLWFMSSVKSQKNADVRDNNDVHLLYSNPGNSEYLSILGNATESKDKKKIEELWNPIAKAWFEDGKDDKDITLIKVTPETAYYWDTKSSKMISMIKMLAATVTGEAPDDGVEGKLKV